MKKLLILLVSVFLIAGCSSSSDDTKDALEKIKEEGKLIVVTSPDYPPNEFMIIGENGEKKIVGSDIDLAQAIADKIGVVLKVQAKDFDGVLMDVSSGAVSVGITGIEKTKAREEVMQFSIPYYRDGDEGYQGILVRKEDVDKYKSLDDVKNAKLKIGAQSASVQYETAQTITDMNKIVQYGTTDKGVLALNSGDIDAMTVPSTQSELILATFPDLVMLNRDEFNLDPDNFYSGTVVAFPKGEQYESLIALVNEVINENIENGNMNKWVEEAKELSLKQIEE